MLTENSTSVPFRKKQLSNSIAEHIRAEILDGTFPPGKFLRLDEVAQELGVSVTPVREAFMALTVEGFVEHAERRGFIVASLKKSDLEDLYTLLAQVSGRLAERAATTMSDKELHQLEEVHRSMVSSAKKADPLGVEYANDEFHRIINRAANSSKLAWILVSILKYVPRRSYASIDGLSDMLVEQHDRVLEAIRDRNPAEAYISMYEHEKISMQTVIDSLEERGIFTSVPDKRRKA